MRFQVGDFVKGTKESEYSITNENSVNMVVSIEGDDYMIVLTLNTSFVLYVYEVRQEYFTKVAYEEIEGMISNEAYMFKNLNLGSETNLNRTLFYNSVPSEVSMRNLNCKVIDIEELSIGEYEKEKEMETYVDNLKIFDSNVSTVWDKEEVMECAKDVEGLLEKYHNSDDEPYRYSCDQVERFVRESNEAKGWIEHGFSKHPEYDREAHAIKMVKSFDRKADKDSIYNFTSYLLDRMTEKLYNEYVVEPPYSKEKHNNISNEINYINTILSAINYMPYDVKNNVKIFDRYDRRYYKILLDQLNEVRGLYNNYVNNSSELVYKAEVVRINNDGDEIRYKFRQFCNLLQKMKERVTAEEAKIINEDLGYYDFARAVEGQKTSTIVKKVAKHFGFDKHEDWQEDTFTTQSGEVKTRRVNYGWNKKFAEFCDAIKPKTKEMIVMISVNPCDYLTMSCGHKWASCQTIDKTNIRKNGSDNYQGMYSGGTVDLALDEATVVMYLLDKDYDGDKYYDQDKIKRCLFYFGEDKIIQSRTYPDGRDGDGSTDFTDMSGQLRKIMLETISECNEKLGEWETIKKGNGFVPKSHMEAGRGSLHYQDYFQGSYGDIYIAMNNRVKLKDKKIVVGKKPFCLCCGETNDDANAIICPSCGPLSEDYRTCEYCGRIIHVDNATYIEDGHYYCDSECAENDGYRWCEDVDDYRYEDYCYYDDNLGRYYSDRDEERIVTSDGECFHGYESAEQAGYVWVEDKGEYYPEDEVVFCEHCERDVLLSNWDHDHYCCYDCLDSVLEEEENAA